MKISTELTRARRSAAALALDPIPASKVQSDPLEIAEFDKHNCGIRRYPATISCVFVEWCRNATAVIAATR
jgi:hypothetical protein